MAELTQRQKDILARTLLGEARGEGVQGMEAVAHVIANRANSGRYPSDPEAVALQPKQFSVWNAGEGGGKTNYDRNSREYETAIQAVERVFSGQAPDPTNGALFYHTPAVNPNWSREANRYGTTQLGNHIFYNGRPAPPRDIPNQVATQQDTRRRITPSMPTQMPATLVAQRSLMQGLANPQQTSTADMYRGIYAQPARASLTQGGQIDRSVNAASGGQDQGLAAALQNYVQRPAPLSAAEVYRNGGPTRPASAPPLMSTVASVPTSPRVTPAANGRNLQAQEQAERRQPRITTVASIPTRAQLPPVAPSRSASPNTFSTTMNRAAAAVDPVLQQSLSRIGQPPTTRVVPSVQVAAQNRSAQPNAAQRAALDYVAPTARATTALPTSAQRSALSYVAPKPIAAAAPTPIQAQRAEQMATRQATPRSLGPIAAPTARQLEANTGFRVPNLSTQPTTVAKDQSRLVAQQYPVAPVGPTRVVAPLAVTGPRMVTPPGYPTPASQRPTGIGGMIMPTPVSQRPVMAQAPRIAAPPLMRASQPLNVVVQGARTQAVAPQPVQQQQVINPANHQAAQLAAIASGQSTFTPAGGGPSEPVRAMNGKVRYTY